MSHAASQWAKTVITGGTTNKAILMVLADYANHSLEAWPSFERVAKEAECSVSTVKRAVADMEARGLLTRQRRRQPDGKLGCYVLVLNVKPQVKMTAGQKPELNLTSGQSDLRSNTTETRAQIELTEPCKIEPLEAAAATAHAPAREPQANLTFGPDWRLRLTEAHSVLGPSVNLSAGGMHTWGPLKALCEPATGPPCAWDDVLDALRQIAARFQARGQMLNSWTHPAIRELACAARDSRLAGNPEIAHVIAEPRHSRHANKPRSRADIIWQLALDAAEAEQRRDQNGDQWNAAPLRIAGGSGSL